ncbi:MAG: glycine--tRNA ligase subunit beta, partial [Pseudomonadota bacterium]
HLAQSASPSFEAALRAAPQDEVPDNANPHPEAPGVSRASKDGGESHEKGLHPEEARSAVAKDEDRSVDAQIADAIRDHYKPAGQDDAVPTAPVSVAVALADKIDTLTVFYAIDKKPTGSSDPFALRRAALGVITIILQMRIRLNAFSLIVENYRIYADYWQQKYGPWVPLAGQEIPSLDRKETLKFLKFATDPDSEEKSLDQGELVGFFGTIGAYEASKGETVSAEHSLKTFGRLSSEISSDLVAFFHDRLKVYLRDNGHRHDRIDAVLKDADGNLQDDFVLIVEKLKALDAFLSTEDGTNLAAGYKRAANILKAEKKKGEIPVADAASPSAAVEPQEAALFAALETAEQAADAAVKAEDFETAMTALAGLRAPIDAFFDNVTVNADDPAMRTNRLALLQRFRAATARVADFSRLEG